jgi:hypothetical protein
VLDHLCRSFRRGREEARMGYMKVVIILKGLVFIRTYEKLGFS